jgi:hypothetical protein
VLFDNAAMAYFNWLEDISDQEWDRSNPIALDGKGGFKKIIPADQSSGQIIAGLLPEGAELVKAFCSISVQSPEAAANRKPELAVLFYATDYPDAGFSRLPASAASTNPSASKHSAILMSTGSSGDL